MSSNYPPGVTDVEIDMAFGGFDYDEPDPTEEEIEEAYLEQIELEAETIPGPVFYELEQPSAFTEAKWIEFKQFLETLSRPDLEKVITLSCRESVKRHSPAVYAAFDLGVELATKKEAA